MRTGRSNLNFRPNREWMQRLCLWLLLTVLISLVIANTEIRVFVQDDPSFPTLDNSELAAGLLYAAWLVRYTL